MQDSWSEGTTRTSQKRRAGLLTFTGGRVLAAALGVAVAFLVSPSLGQTPSSQPTTTPQPKASGSPTAAESQADEPVRNVVLFIGDGVDDHQLTIGRNYLFGPQGAYSFEEFPRRAAARVQTVSEEQPTQPVYVGDSASGGTALSAGVVTSRGRIATRAGTDEDVPTILELAERAGYATGLVVTSSLTDATPASFYAHVAVRYCEGPDDMNGSMGGVRPGCPNDLASRGGPGSIAEQMFPSGVDLALGGGSGPFGDEVTEGPLRGKPVLERWRLAGVPVVRNAEELAGASSLPLIGLFGASTLPVEWIGEGGRTATTLSFDGEGKPEIPEPFSCAPNPAMGSRPTLEAMTRKALSLLEDFTDEAPRGFFLMVESASIDKQAHAANPCGQIGELRALDQAVEAAVEFAERQPDTLILVTSDHGHAGQIVPYPSLFEALGRARGVPQHPAGKFARLKIPAGGEMAVTYGTNENFLEEHTGTSIPVFATGPGSEAVKGLMDQRDVFDVMRAVMQLRER